MAGMELQPSCSRLEKYMLRLGVPTLRQAHVLQEPIPTAHQQHLQLEQQAAKPTATNIFLGTM